MRSVLLAHAARYPLMEPRDAVKLIYQNEFGGGHLIRDEAACLDFLFREYASVKQTSFSPLLEDIGNGILRVNLCALDAHGYSPEQLGDAFLRSAAMHTGTAESFHRKLSLLRKLTAEGAMPFASGVLDGYLETYIAAGTPAVSHSETYRNAYHPAYRVVRKDFLPKQML